MRLIGHQLKKDVRLFGAALVGWWALLALDVTLNLFMPQQVIFHPGAGFSQGVPMVWGWLLTLLWAGVCLFPAAVVMADSPLRENAFIRTRPMAARTVILSKGLFLILCILTPAALAEAIYFTGLNVGWAWTWHAVAERLLFLVPLVTAGAAFGALWRSRNELTVALLAVGAAAWLTFGAVHLVVWCLESFGWTRSWVDDP